MYYHVISFQFIIKLHLYSIGFVSSFRISSKSVMGSSNTKKMKCTASTARCKGKDEGEGDFVEGVVCQESDLQDNQMREFDLNGKGKVLVVKQAGKIVAIGNKCSHYGAPLANGVLGEGRVRCPWHGACFNINTGDIEDFPGLDSVPCYKVSIEKDGVHVRAHQDQLTNNKRVKTMAKRDPENKTTFVVVGMGAAGACCVETLRQEGFKGRLIFVGQEPYIPYDRIKLSKALDAVPDKIQLRTNQFYEDNDIEIVVGEKVNTLDSENKKILLASGKEFSFDSIFLATGSIPRRGDFPGCNLKNVFVLRTISEANSIHSQLKSDSQVVILGASFIGMEVASFCVGRASSVTVIARDSVPFKQVLGEEVGMRLMQLHKEKGVKFEVNVGVDRFDGDVSVNSVVLSDGRCLPCDIVVLGIGATPATEYLEKSGVKLDKSGSVVVDEYLQGTVPGIFAGGDIAYAPVLGTTASIGHWQLAHYHGRVAALNMLGRKMPLNTVPFFWTMMFGKSVRYAGYAPGFDSMIVTGDLPEFKFVVYYCTGQKVVAVATANSDPVAAKFAELLARGGKLDKSEVEADPAAWMK